MVKKCPNCGNLMDNNTSKCEKCGRLMSEMPPLNTENEDYNGISRTRRFLTIIILIFIALIIIGIITLIFLYDIHTGLPISKIFH